MLLQFNVQMLKVPVRPVS